LIATTVGDCLAHEISTENVEVVQQPSCWWISSKTTCRMGRIHSVQSKGGVPRRWAADGRHPVGEPHPVALDDDVVLD
jgi:hypothetical protein